MYQLPINNSPNSLHGGINGFDKKEFNVIKQTSTSIHFQYTSIDEEEGYPGEINVTVLYTLSDEHGLTIDYTAKLVNPLQSETIVNFTNHTYWNLDGFNGGSTLNHIMCVPDAKVLALNQHQIPTHIVQEMNSSNAHFFGVGKAIGKDIQDVSVQVFKGYDHYYLCERNKTSHSDALQVWIVSEC